VYGQYIYIMRKIHKINIYSIYKMEHLDILRVALPIEMINKILYEFKGHTHPTALLIKDYWKELDDEFNIFVDIKIRMVDNFDIDEYGENMVVRYLDYPRLNFPVDYDVIETLYDE